ncbi:unnamed protein product [Caenorhabditis brenneri]
MSLSRPVRFPFRKLPYLCIESVIRSSDIFDIKSLFAMESYAAGNEGRALKMALEFLNDVFRCTVDYVEIEGDNFPKSGDIGVRSTVNLCLIYEGVQEFGPIRNQHLNLLLEKLEVTGRFNFGIDNSGYCDPKLFKCQELLFWRDSSEWVTREILLQFQVPRLTFCELPLEVIVSFVTYWFNSDNKKLEYIYLEFQQSWISLEAFRTAELNPVPFSDRNRIPISESFGEIDFSKGMEIIRHDGLQATIHHCEDELLFYIWH